MKVNELRIGNLVYDEYADGTKYLTQVDIMQIEYPHNCEPVKLTKEWIIKFGFAEGNKCYKNAYSLEVLKTDFYLRPSYQGGFYWGFNISDEKLDCELNDVKPLKYVHELQNLIFAIIGEELQYKIDF